MVGLGIGAEHARAYAALPGCDLRWLYDLDGGRVDALIAALGHGRRAERYETILDDPAVAIVSIASFDDAHADQVVAALEAGKHVFVEKPLCRSGDELSRIERAWRSTRRRPSCPSGRSPGLHLASNLVLRAAPLYVWLREAVTEGRLGRIYAVDGDYLYGRMAKLTDGWRGRIDGYSVMLGGGVHLVDLMLWVTGERPWRVSARGNRICTAGSAFREDDFVAATFEFRSGLAGRVTANFGCVHRHQHVLRVFGTEATFVYDDQGPRLVTSRDPAVPPKRLDLSPLPATKGALIPAFVARVAGGEDPGATAGHDLDVLAACLGADEARATDGPVEVRYPCR